MADTDGAHRGFAIARASERAVLSDRFNPAMLTTAREARGLSQSALAAHPRLDVSQALVGRWEAGLSIPDDGQVAALSVALDVQADFFFVDRPRRLASMSDFYHRALSRARRADVKAVHAKCSIIDLQIDRLLHLAEIPEDRIPDIDPDNHAGNVEKIAMMTRTSMGVAPGPIKSLSRVIEDSGGIVVDQDLGVDDVDALCRWVPALPKLFFVNGAKPADRTRLSLAHELGHTVMHFGRDFEPRLAEDQAFAFAAAFLMPAQDIRSDLRRPLQLSDLAQLKRKWRVSMAAIVKRAHSLGLIDETRYKSLFVQLSRRGWRKTEPVNIERETPQQFGRMLQAHLEAGYTIADLSRLLFVGESQIEEMIADYQAPNWERDGVRLRIVR